MATQLELDTAQFGIDLGLAHDIVHGGPAQVVVTEGGNVASLAKTIADALAAANVIIAPSTVAAQAAETGAVAAQGQAEVARTAAQAAEAGAVVAQGGAQINETGALAAKVSAETAEAGAVAARGLAEAARDDAQAMVSPPIVDLGVGTEIDLATGSWFKKTLAAGPVALTAVNWPAAGLQGSFVLQLKDAGLAALTFPASWHWAGNVAPAFSTDATDIVVAMSGDGGATVFAGVTIFGANPGV